MNQAADPEALAHVVLDVAVGSDPISGFIEDGSGRHAFTGWIDLVGAIAASTEPGQGGPTDAH